MSVKTAKKTYKKKFDIHSKPVRYFQARKRGLSKEAAKKEVGYHKTTSPTTIERTKLYRMALERYKSVLLEPEEIAKEHNKNIKQDADKGAKNKAIEMANIIREIIPKEKDWGEEVGEVRITFRK